MTMLRFLLTALVVSTLGVSAAAPAKKAPPKPKAPAQQPLNMGMLTKLKEFSKIETEVLDKDPVYKQKKAAVQAAGKAVADFRQKQMIAAYRGGNPEKQKKVLQENIQRANKLNDKSTAKRYQDALNKLNIDINRQINNYLKRTPEAQKQMNALNASVAAAGQAQAAAAIELLKKSTAPEAKTILEAVK